MSKNPPRVQHSYNHERIRDTLARVQELNARSPKHQRIRVNQWVKKLLDHPVSNPPWLKNVSEHAATLLRMLVDGVVEEPFMKIPPQGPLPTLPRHKVAHLAAPARDDGTCGRARRPDQGATAKSSALLLRRMLQEEVLHVSAPVSAPKPVETRTKLIQTSDQDDQWDWQRVWKGAFEKMRTELLDRSNQIQSKDAEMKELRAVVAAQRLALEQEERLRDELKTKHRAELDNARSVHALELESLKAKHKKQLQEASQQKDRLLRQRRQEAELGGAFNMQSESYGDFLAYIDDFYADTLKLTQSA